MPQILRKLTTTVVKVNADCPEEVHGLKSKGLRIEEPDGALEMRSCASLNWGVRIENSCTNLGEKGSQKIIHPPEETKRNTIYLSLGSTGKESLN